MSAPVAAVRRVFVAGHRGMVGSAIVRRLEAGRARGVKREILVRDRAELDLRDARAVREYLADTRPDAVVLAAALVGGIRANDTYPADFIAENLAVELAVIDAAHRADVPRLLCLGSSCIYPRDAAQPMREEALLSGPLEPTNEPYAVAKIAGIKLCESYNRQYGRDYRSVMPTNLYGPGDNFHPEDSHVVPGLMRRFHEAKLAGAERVGVWGSGAAKREFLHVDDLAAACVTVLDLERGALDAVTLPRRSHLNVGTGKDCSIAELATTLARVTGFAGRIDWDRSKPDGTPRKLLDVSRLRSLGWAPSIPLEAGLRSTYEWFVGRLESEGVRGV